MRPSSSTSRAALGALALLLVGTAVQCGYDPEPPDGQLGCSTKLECPQGYGCRADNKCWKKSGAGTGGATGGTGGAGGAGGGAAGATPIDQYIGRWTFTPATSTAAIVGCGSDGTPSAINDFMDVELGPTPGTIKATYYCPWILSTPTSGGSATVGMNQVCTATDPKSHYIFTWKASTFTFSTKDGKSATLSSLIAASYVAPDTTTGMCTIRIIGNLTK